MLDMNIRLHLEARISGMNGVIFSTLNWPWTIFPSNSKNLSQIHGTT